MYNEFLVTAALGLLLLVAFGTTALAESSEADTTPSYTESSIVNGTTFQLGPFAPNTMVTIFGKNLTWGEGGQAATPAMRQGYWALPDELAGVRVLIMRGNLGQPVPLHYVGHDQINFVLPESLVDPKILEAGEVEIVVTRDGSRGPRVKLKIQEAAPELFPVEGGNALAVRVLPPADTEEPATYVLATAETPARPGEWLMLYATGLGRTVLRLEDGEVVSIPPRKESEIWLKHPEDLRVMINREPLPPESIGYAGLAPGFAALYQINVKLPDDLPADPEIRIAIKDAWSMEGLRLAVNPGPEQPQP